MLSIGGLPTGIVIVGTLTVKKTLLNNHVRQQQEPSKDIEAAKSL